MRNQTIAGLAPGLSCFLAAIVVAAASAEDLASPVEATVPRAGSGTGSRTDGPAPTDENKTPDGLGQRSEREVTVAEQLSFREQQVAQEMAELEQRMYRLSEGLKKLEPENASRLMLGLKYAREELILHQMRETQAALSKMALKGAVDEQKQLLAKLERLQQLLLSTDLDFEMRLERLRQIRETLRRLEGVIKEESREERVSKKPAEAEKQWKRLAERSAALERLIGRQTDHNQQNAPRASAARLGDEDRAASSKLSEAQEATRKSAKELADQLQDGASPKNLGAAVESMQAAVASLAKPAPVEAQPKMEQALASLQGELEEVTNAEAEAKQALKPEDLAELRKDQEGNRRATEDVIEMTRGLGSSGTEALGELLRAGGSMASAEGALGSGQAGTAHEEQGQALAALKYAREMLAAEAERLARQLRREAKKRVADGLSQMLEMQVTVRQRTVALAPGVKQGSRQAASAVVALAKREEKITSTAQELIRIVKETEFGIALPAALAAVRDAAEGVQIDLAEGNAGEEVVAAEKQIEADLAAMLEVVDEMSEANSKSGRRGGSSPEEQRKEISRILSELKMIRLLEVRVHQSTMDVDGKRQAATLSPALRKRVEDLEGRQEDIRDATEQLATERGDEIPLPK